ncbi:NADAR family protein [Streptomyces sp. NPDC059578]|uniref:NADAR family protein n=1 Tax=Streptomyces sp. NPDC059578 TaxID=3346874 RepID=UPI0036915453
MTSLPDLRDREELRAATASGIPVEYLYFWGHRPSVANGADRSCLSQWYPSPFSVEGVTYATAEHWMMAAKARLFDDPEAERAALTATHPGGAKAAGRRVRNFDEALWVGQRLALVVEGNVHKFGQHPALSRFLLATGSRVLVEASPHDRIWGIGLTADEARASDPRQWPGLNLLGFALMRARTELRRAAGAGRADRSDEDGSGPDGSGGVSGPRRGRSRR